MVSLMTFGKPRINMGGKGSKEDDGVFELSRFASLKSYNVIGAFSKLLKHFIRNYEPKLIRTYADLRYFKMDKKVCLS